MTPESRAISAVDAAPDLQRQIAQLEHLDLAGRMAGRVSHDFNNVLMVILGYSDLLKAIAAEREDGDVSSAVDEIERAARRGAALTRQLSSLGRRTPAELTPVNFAALVRGLERLLGHLLTPEILLEIAADGDAWIDGDAAQLEQVVVNLATNARDAMPSGGRLRIEVAANDTSVTMTVTDTGIGMNDATLERVFDPFFTTKAKAHGTGLGLPIVLASMRQHRGEIRLSSVPGEGTLARVALPASGLLPSSPDR